MTPEKFRQIALSLADATEGEHMGHPDFRVNGRVFASLSGGPEGEERGMVKVTLDEQEELVRRHPEVFEPCAGAWGRQGCTALRIDAAKVAIVKRALESAWREALSKPAPRRRKG